MQVLSITNQSARGEDQGLVGAHKPMTLAERVDVVSPERHGAQLEIMTLMCLNEQSLLGLESISKARFPIEV